MATRIGMKSVEIAIESESVSLTKEEIIDRLEAKGIEFNRQAKKDELLTLLNEHS